MIDINRDARGDGVALREANLSRPSAPPSRAGQSGPGSFVVPRGLRRVERRDVRWRCPICLTVLPPRSRREPLFEWPNCPVCYWRLPPDAEFTDAPRNAYTPTDPDELAPLMATLFRQAAAKGHARVPTTQAENDAIFRAWGLDMARRRLKYIGLAYPRPRRSESPADWFTVVVLGQNRLRGFTTADCCDATLWPPMSSCTGVAGGAGNAATSAQAGFTSGGIARPFTPELPDDPGVTPEMIAEGLIASLWDVASFPGAAVQLQPDKVRLAVVLWRDQEPAWTTILDGVTRNPLPGGHSFSCGPVVECAEARVWRLAISPSASKGLQHAVREFRAALQIQLAAAARRA